MDWKETIMSDEQIEEVADEACRRFERTEDGCKAGDSCMDCRERENAVANAQAEITWRARDKEVEEAKQAGIREVVEFVDKERHSIGRSSQSYLNEYRWQAFKKSKGIE